MNLPPLTIPNIPLPFEIPAMMHPAIIHFAVALPVIIILLEIINLAARKRAIGSISFLLIVLMVLVYLGAYLTGTVDAENAKNALSPEAKDLLEAHKSGGVWMVYVAVVVLVVKLISVAVKKFIAKIVFLILLGLFFFGATGVVQKGCALTYKHGVNVKTTAVKAPTDATKKVPASTSTEVNATVDKVKEEVKQTAKKVVEAVKEKASETVEKTKEKIEESAPELKESAEKIVEAVKEKTTEAVKKVEERTEKAVEIAKEKAAEVSEAVKKVTEPVTEAAPTD